MLMDTLRGATTEQGLMEKTMTGLTPKMTIRRDFDVEMNLTKNP